MKSEKEISVTADAVHESWVYRIAPRFIQPYLKLARADRPVGVWLLLWPCLWGIALAENTALPLDLIALFAVGAFVMRGAGCTYNDIVDFDFDRRVERTKSRPLPAGEVTLFKAWLFLGLQLLIGFAVLMTLYAIYAEIILYLGLAALVLVAIYPFMKRITYWPQAWLGLTFNWGILMGYAAAGGSAWISAILLYVGAIFWTLGYDTIYAHQDSEDDALIGVKSTALKLGAKTPVAITVFYGLFFICIAAVGFIEGFGVIYFAGAAIVALNLASQIKRLDINDSARCLEIFRSNIRFGLILFVALFAETSI